MSSQIQICRLALILWVIPGVFTGIPSNDQWHCKHLGFDFFFLCQKKSSPLDLFKGH